MAWQYIIDPAISGHLYVGTEGIEQQVYIGRIDESGGPRKIFFGGSGEFVSLIIGKRGSGKSHTLGNIVEGLATKDNNTSISNHLKRRGVLLLDPMGNFWTTAHKVSSGGTSKVQTQYALFEGWDCSPEDINVEVFLPAGFINENDPPFIKDFHISVSELDDTDLADLIEVNLVKDPQGAALSEAFVAVTIDGWKDGDILHPAIRHYSISNLISYLEWQKGRVGDGDHSPSTLRALIRSLRVLGRLPVFSGKGTPLTKLLSPGKLSVLMLPHKVGHDLRLVITRLLIRRILREREEAAQIQQRLDIEKMDERETERLTEELALRVPRSVLAIDEAQDLLGDEGGGARRALDDFCLLGRNFGLSLLLATQRPSSSAISAKVRSQVDFTMIHRLVSQSDIANCYDNLLSEYPTEVRVGERVLKFSQLVRQLDRGQAIISASYAVTEHSETVNRIVVAQIRPRVTVHGGEVS
ncbi:DUF87 domain-containing protein [Photobacterium profundum]|uniref:ATP-binding protein n=1 Tax=Photobacterium profundum TaxID=74109 RepID=UPI003D118C8C